MGDFMRDCVTNSKKKVLQNCSTCNYFDKKSVGVHPKNSLNAVAK